MPEPLVFLNDRFLPQSQAHLTLHDAGFVQGATVTDLVRTFQRRLYRWEDHLRRFGRSCQAAEIYPPLPIDDIAAKAERLVAHNATLLYPGQELALVLFATPGPIGHYLGEPGSGSATFGLHTFPLPFARYRPWIENGVSLVVPNVRAVPAACLDPRVKQRSRMHWWLADRAAQRLEAGSVALLCDERGHITETAGSNVLLVEQGRLVSPPRDTILEGISLQVVRELAELLGLSFSERPLTVYDCHAADELLLTGTTTCLLSVRSCQFLPKRFRGPVFQRLLKAWNDAVGVEIHGQMLDR